MINSSKPFRIAIVGGGIGGLFAALCINQFCSSATDQPLEINVYEQARAYREVGAGIGIGINATRLLHHVGIGEKINAIAGRRKNVWISFRRFDNGENIITVPLDDTVPRRQAPVFRPEFLEILKQECLDRNVGTLHVQKKCEKINVNDDKTITLYFKDGTETTADFIIGADGIHSVIREHFVQDDPIYSGQIAYRGVVDIEKVKPFWKYETFSVNWVAHDRHLFVYPISANTRMNVVGFKHVKPDELGELKESWSSMGTREGMLKDFDGFEDQALGVIACMSEKVLKWKLNDRDPFDPWVFADGRIVLLGDAAHAVLPHQGAGGGQSMEDGYILALALRDYFKEAPASTDAALLEKHMQFYQELRLPRAQAVQNQTRETSRIYELQTPVFEGKNFEQCLPIFVKTMEGRMNWIWHEEVDTAYERARAERFR